MLLKCNRHCASIVTPLHCTGSPSSSLFPSTSRHSWLPRCKPLSSKRLSSLRTQTSGTPPQLSTPSRYVACSASEEDISSISRRGPAKSSQSSSKQPKNQRAGTHNGSRAKGQGSAAKEKDGCSPTQWHDAHQKQSQSGDSGTGGKNVKHRTDAEGVHNSAPLRSSRRQWQGQSGQQGVGQKRTMEGTSPTRSSNSSSISSSSQSSKRPKTRQTSDTGATPRAKSGQVPSLHECVQEAKAAGSPQQSFKILYHLGKRVQGDQNGMKKYTGEECEGIVEAAHALAAQVLGMQAPTSLGSNSSTKSASFTISGHTSSPSPLLQLDSKQLSLTIWAFSQLVDADSRARSRHLCELVDAIAARAVGSSVMNTTTDDACMHWSRLLYGIAKMGFSCPNLAVQQLFETGAKLLPQMMRQRQKCEPQDVSNSLSAFAKAKYGGSLHQLVSEVASNLGWVMKNAKSQEWSNAVWALATLHSQKVVLGEFSTVVKIVSAGAEGMVQQRRRAKPQELSNTLWALATLGHNPGNATIDTLAIAMAESRSTAKPQELSNTLWALADLDHNPDGAIFNNLAAAMAEKSSTAKPQELSISLQAMGSLRWYQPEVYSKLVERLVHSNSSSDDSAGQQFSNALFSCALSCHFDSSVDALAAWGSQQGLQQWTEQAVSNALYAWAMLTATSGGDTAHMRALAQQLFQEASWRGAASFTVENDLGKLYSAHQEAVHMGLPGGGLADPQLLQVVKKHFTGREQSFDERDRSFTSIIATALQGHHEIQAATVLGYNTRLVLPESCPRGIAIVVTQRYRDCLNHPARQLYGKAALRMKHIERGCDGLVLCDESELKGSSLEQQREMLFQRIEQVVGNQKQVCRRQCHAK